METTVVLAVMSILAGSLAPVVSGVIRKQKLYRAQADVVAIRDAIIALTNDVLAGGLAIDASQPLGKQQPVFMAVGDGDVPELGSGGSPYWLKAVDLMHVDFLENHLVRNRPGSHPDNAYRDWQGPYISPVKPDPWGNRYMVNTIFMWTPYGLKQETVVISAGPDEEIDSKFTVDGFVADDDDIIAIVTTGKGTNDVPDGLIR